MGYVSQGGTLFHLKSQSILGKPTLSYNFSDIHISNSYGKSGTAFDFTQFDFHTISHLYNVRIDNLNVNNVRTYSTGAVSLQSKYVQLEINNSHFEDNIGSNSAKDLYVSKYALLTVNNSEFVGDNLKIQTLTSTNNIGQSIEFNSLEPFDTNNSNEPGLHNVTVE